MTESNIITTAFILFDSGSTDGIIVTEIQPRLNVSSVQNLADGGLSISFICANTSPIDLVVKNPLDYLNFVIVDEEGWPVIEPPVSSKRALMTPGEEAVEIIRPYSVHVCEKLGSHTNDIDCSNDEHFLMKAKKEYEFSVNIEEVQDYVKESEIKVSTKTKNLEKGKYSVTLKLTLVLKDQHKVYAIWDSVPVTIELK